MLDKLRLILYLILIFIGLIALLYIAPIFLIVSIIILWMGIKDLDKRENKKDYDINKKLSSLNNKERVESCTLKYENELTTVDIYSEENNQIEEDSYPNIDKYNFYITNEEKILSYFYERCNREDLGILRTTGENSLYKKKLRDKRWIEKREKIRKRDRYRCQYCHNIYVLKDINELYEIVDFEEIASCVIDVYKQIQKNEIKFEVDKDLRFNQESYYIPKYNLWMNYFYEDLSRLPILYQSMLPARKMQILSDVKCSTKDTYEYYLKSLKSSLRYKRKGKKTGFIDSILIEHDDRIKTSHKFFLCQNIERDNRFAYQGRARIFIDGYSIIFPLYEIKLFNTLEVHHKRYPRSKNPWDVDDADLITLCSKCHKLEHQKFK